MHRCADCSGEITIGSPALVVAVLIDGDFWAGYRHSPSGQCVADEEYQ